ncbi:recombinase [Uruburuella testudinis]|uniref:Recombinase n=1 Tax=Uruburuella testudinis TaxID=1282863 RepID=A0ABY4DVM8_9NEIS|nr:recombinase [Uruburuella testudinis]UOO80736.1 recombinase [Uruburuella testudinis]
MIKITPRNLHTALQEQLETGNFVALLDALVHFIRKGGSRHAAERFDMLLELLTENPELCHTFGTRFHFWLSKIHVYPALVGLGVFSRNGFGREVAIRIYERFIPSYKELNNLKDVFLYLFRSHHDETWLQTLSLRQWLNLYGLLSSCAGEESVQAASRQITQARLHALEMLAIWVAAEELEPDFIRIEPKLLDVDSAFVALQREVAVLVAHYRMPGQTQPYDTAHIEVMLEQCQNKVTRLRRKGTGAGAGSSVKVAHLLERLQQTLERLKRLLDIQTSDDETLRQRQTIVLLNTMTLAAVEQHSTSLLRRRSIKMLAKSISENTSDHGEHYITRNRSEYWGMLRSAVGGGVLIALMALNKIHIGNMGFSEFTTSLLAGLNYGLGFMLIHMLHFTVATKQPAMTAASFAEEVERNDKGRVVNNRLATLLIDVARSQSVAVFGNVSVAILLAALIAFVFAGHTGAPLLSADNTAYQLKSLQPFTQPTLWYAAIAGLWLFCSGIISGFFDNRADYLDLRRRLTVHPVLKKIMPARLRVWFAGYLHHHYGSLAGNFMFGMLLGMTGWFGHLLNLPLDIRHVAFSSANLGYAAISGHIGLAAFMLGLLGVVLIGLVNLWVSFMLALFVALRSRDTRIDSMPALLKSVWAQIRANPLNLFFPIEAPTQVVKNAKSAEK